MSLELADRIEADLVQAAKARDEVRLQSLRLLKSALKNYSIEVKGDVSPQQMLQILQKEVKKRHEAATLYTEAGRPELADKEKAEQAILEEYLPSLPDEMAIRQQVQSVISERGLSGQAAMGQVISTVREHFEGALDGALLAQIAREELN